MILVLRPSNHFAYCGRNVAFIIVGLFTSSMSWGEPGSSKKTPAEERRLSTAVFREGLKQRGLHDLLELHLKDYPLQSPVDERLMQRDVELARFHDPRRSSEERRTAIQAANAILEKLIADYPSHPSRLEWMYLLGWSLVFYEAEPPATNILYFGGVEQDFLWLGEAASKATEVVRTLESHIEAEFRRIDGLSADQLAGLESSGYLDRLDRIAPNAQYVLLWAFFYDALSRPPSDPSRVDRLQEINALLESSPGILTTPQEESRVQVPAYVVAGMTMRRLGQLARARTYLTEAQSIGDRLSDQSVRAAVFGPVILAGIEEVRLEIEAEQWQVAATGIDRLHRRVAENFEEGSDQAFVLRVVVATLEREMLVARSVAAAKGEREEDEVKFRRQSWQGLAVLASTEPLRRDRLYAIMYRTLSKDIDPNQLDPIQRTAFLFGLLQTGSAEELRRAVAIGEGLLQQLDASERVIVPQILELTASAHYRQGDLVAAARCFLQMAREYPDASGSQEWVEMAVKLIASSRKTAKPTTENDLLYSDALALLLQRSPDTESGRYWRFFYAEHLYTLHQFDAALAQFAMVYREHEYALEAGLRQIQVQADAIRELSATTGFNEAELRGRTDRLLSSLRKFIVDWPIGASREDATGAMPRLHAAANARLTVAEALVLPQVGRYDLAFSDTSDFEDRFGDLSEFRSRLWRVRILASAALDRLQEAQEVIPAYVSADPGGAGATLQALYTAAYTQWERLPDREAKKKAETCLALAQALSKWAENATGTSPDQRRLVRVQLGEATLAADQPDVAKQVFQPLLAGSSTSTPTDVLEIRAALGYAKSLAKLGRCEEALLRFNRLATGLSPATPWRWEALYGDLRCRTSLGHDPAGIIRVLQQQKKLHPDLGGPRIEALLTALLRENEERQPGSPQAQMP